MLFGSFYCFNLEYPEGASITLEFIQRCLVKINPKRGTKSRGKKYYIIHPKVLTLVKQIKSFEADWDIESD
ncbi:hypothetical protein HOLleu_00648 [Holothuria leucospilota]|uniref:Uncharacterized protein n=1 Tax=Holothuria leucospilota TaxID=206669 RepID=A0A9Q1CDL1_HOLLE|nr:hypothetical protein HOLleu_10403 [Holothuria leucospilota]KAJ8048366.1 hypothetical protein HOLleu_00648 [Holothuria leucospilota]